MYTFIYKHLYYIQILNDLQYGPVHTELEGFWDATHVFDIGIVLSTRHGSLADVVRKRQEE